MAAVELVLGVVNDDWTFPGTAGQAREIVCPAGARTLYVRAAGDVKLSTAGPDGSAPASVIPMDLVAGDTWSIRIPGSGVGASALRNPKSVFLTSTVNSDPGTAWAVAEERR
jgi:hypothetical protein